MKFISNKSSRLWHPYAVGHVHLETTVSGSAMPCALIPIACVFLVGRYEACKETSFLSGSKRNDSVMENNNISYAFCDIK